MQRCGRLSFGNCVDGESGPGKAYIYWSREMIRLCYFCWSPEVSADCEAGEQLFKADKIWTAEKRKWKWADTTWQWEMAGNDISDVSIVRSRSLYIGHVVIGIVRDSTRRLLWYKKHNIIDHRTTPAPPLDKSHDVKTSNNNPVEQQTTKHYDIVTDNSQYNNRQPWRRDHHHRQRNGSSYQPP